MSYRTKKSSTVAVCFPVSPVFFLKHESHRNLSSGLSQTLPSLQKYYGLVYSSICSGHCEDRFESEGHSCDIKKNLKVFFLAFNKQNLFYPLCHSQSTRQDYQLYYSALYVYYTVNRGFSCPLSIANHCTCRPSQQLSQRNLTGSVPLLEQAPNCLDRN